MCWPPGLPGEGGGAGGGLILLLTSIPAELVSNTTMTCSPTSQTRFSFQIRLTACLTRSEITDALAHLQFRRLPSPSDPWMALG